MLDYFPIALGIKNRKTVIVGGGQVAQRKAISLLAAGAQVEVISPALTPKLRSLARSGKITWRAQPVNGKDIRGAFLVVAATDNHIVNKNVSRWAKHARILVNVVDAPVLSDFISPAVVRADKALVAVYTDGKDPVLSRDLKNYLEEKWDEFLSYRSRL